jgi:hypothetical protein
MYNLLLRTDQNAKNVDSTFLEFLRTDGVNVCDDMSIRGKVSRLFSL